MEKPSKVPQCIISGCVPDHLHLADIPQKPGHLVQSCSRCGRTLCDIFLTDEQLKEYKKEVCEK